MPAVKALRGDKETTLDLAKKNLTNAEAMLIAEMLKTNTALQTLNLGGDEIGDDGGRVDQMELRSRNGDVVTITGNNFRREFGLKSNWYGATFGPPDASAEFPAQRFDEYRLTTGYTEEEWALVASGADYLSMTPAEFQRAAIWVTSFLLNLSQDPDGPAARHPRGYESAGRPLTRSYPGP